MSGQAPPALWLHCGRCCQCGRDGGRVSYLARITPVSDPVMWPGWHPQRLENAAPLPGDNYVVREWHRDVAYEMRPGRGGTGFVHLLTCLRCKPSEGTARRTVAGREVITPAPEGFVHRLRQEQATRMWKVFTATRQAGNVIHLPVAR